MKWVNKVLLGLGLGFLVYLVWKTGPGELWRQVEALGWGVLLLVGAEGLANLAHTVGWRHCIQGAAGRVDLRDLFRMATAGYAINYLTPTASVGGEVSRAALLATHQKGHQAVTSVLLDKLMTAIAHLALVVGGALLLLWRVSLPIELWVGMGVVTALLTGGMTAFLLLQKHGKLGSLCRWLVEHKLGGRALQESAEQLSKVDRALQQFYREHPGHLVLSVAWHIVGHAVALLHAWLFLWLLGQPAPLATVASAGLLSLWFDLLTFAVPMNLGTLEGSRIVVFKALGCQALLGMAFGVAVRIAQVFWACFGLACYARFNAPASRQGSAKPDASLAGVAASATADLPRGLRGQRTNDR